MAIRYRANTTLETMVDRQSWIAAEEREYQKKVYSFFDSYGVMQLRIYSATLCPEKQTTTDFLNIFKYNMEKKGIITAIKFDWNLTLKKWKRIYQALSW